MTNQKARGVTKIETAQSENFVIVLGCRPGAGVRADTKMCENLCEGIRLATKPLTDLVTFPYVLDSLVTEDTNLEVIKTSTCINIQLRNVSKKFAALIYLYIKTDTFKDHLEKDKDYMLCEDGVFRKCSTDIKLFFHKNLDRSRRDL